MPQGWAFEIGTVSAAAAGLLCAALAGLAGYVLASRRGRRRAAALEALIENLPEPIALRDARGGFLVRNHRWRRLEDGGGLPAGEPEAWQEQEVVVEGRPMRLCLGTSELEQAKARAEAASEAKSRFLAAISHEFRTPLNGILGMTRLLMETPLDAEQKTYAAAVQSSAEAFLSLVGDLLDMARIEAGRIELAEDEFDLAALAQGVVELLAPRAQGKGTQIACFVAAGVPRTVRGDPDRLRQVLFNLAGNAVKFTARGGSGIRIERTEDERISFVVEDSGPGIAPDQAATIFEEFEQAGPASDGEDGTGLGLSIARRLVERMGGRISLESRPGEGSRFGFSLPMPGTGAPTPPPPCRRSVLILSRSPFEAPYLARTIEEAGGEARIATSLADMVALLEEQRFDALLADHGLADEDARVVAREAARRGVARVLILLSPFERRDFGPPHAAGFDGYLIKPVRPRSLFEQIEGGQVAQATAPTKRTDPAAPMPGGPPRRRVLLVEDNAINALLAVKTLERLGAQSAWAKDGADGLALIEASLAGGTPPFDLVLTDLHMPGLDGYEMTRRVREMERRRGRGGRLRIVALTASVVGEADDIARRHDLDGLLIKPFEPEALAALVVPNPLREAS